MWRGVRIANVVDPVCRPTRPSRRHHAAAPEAGVAGAICMAGSTALPVCISGREPDGPAAQAVLSRAKPTRASRLPSDGWIATLGPGQVPSVRTPHQLHEPAVLSQDRGCLEGDGDLLPIGCGAPFGLGPELRAESGVEELRSAPDMACDGREGASGERRGCFAPSTGRGGPCGRAPAIAVDDIGRWWPVAGSRAGFHSVLRHPSGSERTSPD
jgi:hypothetical protein